ncbi:MAG: hypothetical protein LBU83_12845 [Bacteroidales bacterium]|jgi:hypothetical protein|nr:hypothetical protein [Bacteroidales bacterium]
MKKNLTLFFTLILIGNLSCQNCSKQKYISEIFSFVTSKSIQTNIETNAYNNISAISNNSLFVINRKGFNDQTHKGYAKVSKINIITGIEDTYLISPSTEYIENGGIISRIWIWAIASTDSLLFLAVDEEIWIYFLDDSNHYEFYKTVALAKVSHLEITNHDLHAFVDNDDGFDWYKINLSNFGKEMVRQLELKNRFFLQIAPVQMIAVKNNALYFLQRNEPSIEKYSLTGELLANYVINIEKWKNIPNEIAKQLDDIEDITERNYAFSKFSVFEYNFMHLFYVFPNERFFMIALDKNEDSKTFITPYFIQIIGDTTIVKPYSVKLNENDKFGDKWFPFLTANAEGNLVFAQLNEYITQINRSTTVSWQNKTQNEFKQEVNLFHRDNDPFEKIETFKFIKNYIPLDSIQFFDYDDNVFSLSDIEKDKAIFIISQYPQCSSCIKSIWSYFSNKTLPDVEVYNVAQNCSTYLLKKDNIKEVNSFLKTDYTPLFLDTKELNSSMKLMLAQKTNPVVLLFNKRLQHMEVISGTHIIGDIMGNLNSAFIQTINNFVNN